MTHTQSLRTHAPAGWVTASQSGIRGRVLHWRKTGRLVVGADCVQVVEVTNGWPCPRPVWYFKPAALKRVRREVEAPQSGKLKGWWAANQHIEVGGRTLVTLKAATEVLGVHKTTVHRWTRDGCEHLPCGANLYSTMRTVRGKLRIRYWSLAELEEVKRIRLRAPREATGDDVYTLDQTAERTGVSKDLLRREADRDDLNLIAVFRRATVGTNRPGRNTARMIDRLAFSKASVDAYVERRGLPKPPPGMITVREAAAALGASTSAVIKWAAAGILRGDRLQPIRARLRRCWLIEEASVHEARAVIREYGGVDSWLRLGEKLKGRSAGEGEPEPRAMTQTGGQIKDQAAPPTPEAIPQAVPVTRRVGGRPRSEKVEEVYSFCHKEREVGRKLSGTLREATRRFGPRAPKDEAAVSRYAKRYAERLKAAKNAENLSG